MFNFGNWTVAKRLVVGFGLSALTLVIIAVVSYFNTSRLIENDGWVKHTYQVRSELELLLSYLKDAETGQRGYIITGEDSYLEPYKSALNGIAGTMDDLRSLTSDNPNQQRRLASLAPLIDTKLNELKETIDLRRSQGFEAAQKIVTQNVGKAAMDRARAIIGDADREEQDLLTRRADEAKAYANLTTMIIIWGGLLGTLAVIAIGWFISRSLANQIGSAVGQVRSSSTELQAAANQQATGAKEQASAMTEISTTISELLATSCQIAESAQRVAHNAEQTATAARSGHGTVDSTHESIGQHPQAGRSDRRAHARARQEVARGWCDTRHCF